MASAAVPRIAPIRPCPTPGEARRAPRHGDERPRLACARLRETPDRLIRGRRRFRGHAVPGSFLVLAVRSRFPFRVFSWQSPQPGGYVIVVDDPIPESDDHVAVELNPATDQPDIGSGEVAGMYLMRVWPHAH
jgi:hypothetical protein